jgi:hypothetical protein
VTFFWTQSNTFSSSQNGILQTGSHGTNAMRVPNARFREDRLFRSGAATAIAYLCLDGDV